MNCLFCGKAFTENASEEEIKNQWHGKCVKAFFKCKIMPRIDVSRAELEELINKTVNKGLTVPGVQKKISLHLSDEKEFPRLTIVDYPTGYILKPQSNEYIALPEAEHFAMKLAEKTGINTVPSALIKLQYQEGTPFAFITKRVDRVVTSDGVKLYAMEDFCQLGLRLTQDKYKSSCERVGKILRQYSSRPGIDIPELFMRLVFCYLIGNSDMHLKNFSLIETEAGSRNYILSPAYDLLPVNVVMPEDTEESALPLNGKKRNITRKDLLVFAEGLDINRTAAIKMIKKLLDMEEIAHKCVDDSYMPEDMKTRMHELMEIRFGRLV